MEPNRPLFSCSNEPKTNSKPPLLRTSKSRELNFSSRISCPDSDSQSSQEGSNETFRKRSSPRDTTNGSSKSSPRLSAEGTPKSSPRTPTDISPKSSPRLLAEKLSPGRIRISPRLSDSTPHF